VTLPRSARRVQEALRALELGGEVRELDDSTRTAVEAAAAVGCPLGAIVKSLVFRGESSGDGVLVLVSGDNRADEALVAAAVGEPVARSDADFVRAVTGYAIGGVPPVGHPSPLRTLVDEDLLRFAEVWAAAGTPRAVFPVEPGALASAIGVAPAPVAVRN
jgi:prolyl-tRNA editing enzyme YbaK/EbsC (Cys-tRNA(Pro) deacylase)